MWDARGFKVALVTALAFYAIGCIRLWLPASLAFDERYYIGAALNLADLQAVVNREHPLLAKELLAAGVLVFGESLIALRLVALLAGSMGVFFAVAAFARHTKNPDATTCFAVLLLTGVLALSLSRLAILEPFLFAFAAASAYFMSGHRYRLAAVCVGLAMACKWTMLPLAICLFAVLVVRRNWPEAAFFAAISLATYCLTFAPYLLVEDHPLTLTDFPALHLAMKDRLGLYVRSHPYASSWWEWLYGGGAIGLGQGLSIQTNPLTALPASIALLAFRNRFISIAGLACLAMFPLSGKPVLLIHQFLLPHVFMLAALALCLAAIPRRFALAGLAASIAGFLWAVPRDIPARVTSGLAVTPAAQERLDRAIDCLEKPRICY